MNKCSDNPHCLLIFKQEFGGVFMEYRDLAQEWKEFKQYRRKIEPYANDLDMVQAISNDPPHFFPWYSWLIILMLGGSFCGLPLLFLWFNLRDFGLLIVYFPLDVGWVALLCICVSAIVLSIFQRDRFMAISPEGITIPRFLRSSVFIAWREIRSIRMRTNLLNTHAKLIILHVMGQTTTDLELFKCPYLRGLGKEFRIIKILRMYVRTQVYAEDPIHVEWQIDRAMKEQRSSKQHLSEILIPIVLIVGGWITGWLLGLSLFPQLIILVCVVIISQVLMRRNRSYTGPGIIVVFCILIIILTILFAPLFPNPFG